MRVLVLGGYGLIGSEIMRALTTAGFDVVGLGRDGRLARRFFPDIDWRIADMAAMTAPEDWAATLDGINAVVNAAGALQDGPRDSLERLHHKAVAACVVAAERARVGCFVQISAPGASEAADTEFLRTKARGDAAVRASALDWTILKPGLVIARGAYGGTALVRMLAAIPFVTPLALADAKIQTVAADDVARAVILALRGEVPSRAEYDLVEDAPHALRDIVSAVRCWLGFGPSQTIALPRPLAAVAGWKGDLAGLFGWRSPLRTTALKALDAGVIGDPAPWRAASGARLKSLGETLAAMPATAQERLYARVQLALPLALFTLGFFWIASGVIGLASRESATAHLREVMSAEPAALMLWGGAALDILVGFALLLRRTARAAAFASILVAAGYLVAGSFLTPWLWIDPLGAFVKIFPAMALGAFVALALEPR